MWVVALNTNLWCPKNNDFYLISCESKVINNLSKKMKSTDFKEKIESGKKIIQPLPLGRFFDCRDANRQPSRGEHLGIYYFWLV